MSGNEIKPQKVPTPEEAKRLTQAFSESPGMQRLRKLFSEAPPPWPKVRDLPQEGP